MSDYEELYQSGWANIPEPQLLPTGTWELALSAVFYNPPKEPGKSPRFSFSYEPVAPLGDVRKAELDALNGYDWSENRIYAGVPFFWGSTRDRRKILEHIQKRSGFTFSDAEPLLIQTDEGDKVNPEVIQQLRGARIVAKLGLDEYKGETRNVATDFVPVKQVKAA